MISLLLAITIAQPPQKPTPLPTVVAIHSLAVGLDIASTEYALAGSGREANPLLRDRGTRLALKAAQITLLVSMDRLIEKRSRKAAKWWRIGVVVFHSAIAVWNVSQRR